LVHRILDAQSSKLYNLSPEYVTSLSDHINNKHDFIKQVNSRIDSLFFKYCSIDKELVVDSIVIELDKIGVKVYIPTLSKTLFIYLRDMPIKKNFDKEKKEYEIIYYKSGTKINLKLFSQIRVKIKTQNNFSSIGTSIVTEEEN